MISNSATELGGVVGEKQHFDLSSIPIRLVLACNTPAYTLDAVQYMSIDIRLCV